MNYTKLFCSITLLASLALIILPAQAAGFSDVQTGYIYKGQVEALAEKGIIKGNPDGTFRPDNTVNRAEMLTFLYRAAGKNPSAPSKGCFKDVGASEWYSAVVCDAAARGYIGGYADGTFKPGNPVNRVESLKMIHTVLGLLVVEGSTDPLKAYADVSLSAWYASYMSSAFARNILPIEGQTGSSFRPESALKRGEAAAYMFNALGLKLGTQSSSSQRSAASEQSSSAIPITSVTFPFNKSGAFDALDSALFTFDVTTPVTGKIEVNVNPNGGVSGVSCQLYKINSTGFALEYYIGHVMGNTCFMRVSLGAGSYQMEVRPRDVGATYDIASSLVSGDGNDGFRQALRLNKDDLKTSQLEVDDHADWFMFKVTAEQRLTVEVAATDNLRCLIYPMEDVDLFGFSGPLCNEVYDFPPGTYYVGVQRHDGRNEKQSFTIRYK